MSYKIILVDSSIEENYYVGECHHESSDIKMSVTEFSSVKDMLENAPKNILDDFKSKGWINLEDIKNREDKVKALKEYFIMRLYCGRFSGGCEHVNINNVEYHHALDLARDNACLFQKISTSCLSGESKKTYDKARKDFLAEEKKKAKTKKESSKKKEEKKLDKAKKLLEKAGMKVVK